MNKFLAVSFPKERFLEQVRQMILHTGITHENILLQDNPKQETITLKSLLIQLVQQGESGRHDPARVLLHLINGLQLHSVHETNNFIQATLQIPGGILSLRNDISLDVKSKKTKKGNINPDYCHILFYLDLKKLQETIIDMNIQNRLVSITIFNDQKHIKDASTILEPNPC